MSNEVLLVVIAPDGFPVPWLFESSDEAEDAIKAFASAGVHPLIYQEGLWNAAFEVEACVEQWDETERAAYAAANPPGRTT